MNKSIQRLALAAICALANPSFAVPPSEGAAHGDGKATGPSITDAAQLKAQMKVAEGIQVDLFAADPLLANPVCLYVDEAGKVYVCESYRQDKKGIPDNRSWPQWLNDDLASTSIEDRRKMYEKHVTPALLAEWQQNEERIVVLEDTKGAGHADKSTVFADGFKDLLDGTGAGILVRRGDVWYTCIPSLYHLKDTKGTGKADVREALHTGYGIKVALRGHDMHGLRFGPDGKLYFSIGDRSYNVVNKEGQRLADYNSGAVFRCNPDGTELEVFATGLRNPQELVFDNFGNLWTGDNNSDAGDKARWVYVVEGGDSGWRMSYQSLKDRGPWMPEKWWDPPFKGQAAFVVPPVGHITNGPSGLTYYPGTGMSDKYDNHFFLCDFKGSPNTSGIYSFTVEPKGAGFEMKDVDKFLWGVLVTDCDFGPDGAMYVSDWVEGWTGAGKGRIWKLSDPRGQKNKSAVETKRLIAEGFGGTSSVHLIRYLAHPDQRVRLEAQFALAAKGAASTDAIQRVVDNSGNPLARLHGTWALGQIAKKTGGEALENLINNLQLDDPEVRAQTAKVLGDLKAKGAAEKLVPLLEDRSTRVQFFAAIALGKIGHPPAVKSLLEVLRRNKDEDPWLRHAAVMGLVGCADDAALLSAASDESASVRMGVLLALRRHGSAEVARFLKDSDPLLVVEAARAINDAPINAAMEPLAALIEKPSDDAALMRRVVNANFRVGKPENAAALAKFAASTANEAMRVDALSALADWASPSPRDRVMGLWRPLPSRDGKPAADALQSALPNLLASAPIAVQAAAAETAAKLRIKEAIAPLHQAAMEEKAPGKSRVAYMRALAELKDPQLADVVKPALNDKNSDVRKQAQRLVVQIGGDANLAIDVLKDVMKDGTISEKQAAIATLATMKTAAADQLLLKQMEMIGKPKLAKELELDLQLAAESRRKDNSEFDTRLKQMEKHWGNDPLGPYRAAMYGGDAEEGKKVFHDHPAAQCLRCHKMEGTGGEAGPDLSKVGSRGERPYLLESLIVPSAKIVPGYGTVVLTLKNGNVVAGALRSEENGKITMIDPANKTVEVNAADVASRTEPVSAMPPMGAVLSKKELRDVIEYLAGQK